jgi:hypothetical protein
MPGQARRRRFHVGRDIFSAPAHDVHRSSRVARQDPPHISRPLRNAFCNPIGVEEEIMFLQRLLRGAIGTAAIVAMPLVAAAQWPHHGGHHGGPMPETQTQTHITGTVEAVKNLAGPDDDCCCGAGGGTHLTVKTASESIEVHLGPTVWLREQGINLAAGDTVEILGSRVTMRGVPVLMAREVKKGESTWTLRPGMGRGASNHH